MSPCRRGGNMSTSSCKRKKPKECQSYWALARRGFGDDILLETDADGKPIKYPTRELARSDRSSWEYVVKVTLVIDQ